MFHNPAAHTVEVKAMVAFGPNGIDVSGRLPEVIPSSAGRIGHASSLSPFICSLDCLHQRGMVTLDGVIQLDRLREELLEQALKAVIDFSLIAGDLPGNIPDPALASC